MEKSRIRTSKVFAYPQLTNRLPKSELNLLSAQLTAHYSNDNCKMVVPINI